MKSSDLKQKLGIVYALVAITVVVIVVVGVIIFNGSDDDDDDDDDTPSVAQEQKSSGDDGSGSPPPLKTVAVERGEGKNAAVSVASPSLQRPKQIWLRVSAAPKQEVNGSWNVSCGGGSVAMDMFTVTPPDEMKLEIPREKADSCIAGASAQLDEAGRVKLTILRDR